MGRTRVGRVFAAAACAALVSAGLFAPSTSAQETVLHVTRTDDPKPNGCKPHDCSLREAVIASNGSAGTGRIHDLAPKTTYRLTRRVNGGMDTPRVGDLDVVGSLKLRGAGSGSTRIVGPRGERVFQVSASPRQLILRNIRVSSRGAAPAVEGSGSIHLRKARINGLIAQHDEGSVWGTPQSADSIHEDGEGGIFLGSGDISGNIKESGTDAQGGLTLNGVSLHGANGDGVVVASPGSTKLTSTRIYGNQGTGFVTSGGPTKVYDSLFERNGEGGVEIDDAGLGADVEIYRSSFIANRSPHDGAGVRVRHGASVEMIESTVATNRAKGSGGGVYVEDPGSNIFLYAVTVARNVANSNRKNGGVGGGVASDGDGIGAKNSLVAANWAYDHGSTRDCATQFGSVGFNLVGFLGNACSGFGPTDIKDVDAKLGTLGSHDGPRLLPGSRSTPVISLRKGSPAINAADPESGGTDQRGRNRGEHPDIGSFERGGSASSRNYP